MVVGVVAEKYLPAQPSEEEFRLGLRSGIILCNALNRVKPGAVPKVVEAPSDSVIVPDGAALRSYQYFENVRNFLDSIEEMGIPAFEASDLEQGGKSSRIVNSVLALKSYNEWKGGGGKGVWKFSGNSKPPSAGKQFVRKNADLFMNFLSRNSSTIEKSLDSLLNEQNSYDGLAQDLHDMDSSNSLYLFVRQLLSDKKREDIPVIVESMLSKVMEEFERRLASQNEQAGTNSSHMDVPSSSEHRDIEPAGMITRYSDVSSSTEQAGTTSRDTNVPSPDNNIEIEASSIMENKSRSENDFRGSKSKEHHPQKSKELAVKHQHLVEHHHRSIQEIRYTLHSAKEDLHMLCVKYQEEVQSLGKHLYVLANSAARYQKVLEENRKLYNQVQDLKGHIRVYCRIQPFLPGQATGFSTVEAIDEQTLTMPTPAKNGKGRKLFTFNRVFGPSASQEEVFSDTQPLIRSVLDGYNVCIFAYGQTGSGKTYTMTGPDELTPESLGIIYRALGDLFSISEQRKDSISYDIAVQIMEIYNEQVRDLLVTEEICNNSADGVSVPDANRLPVRSTSDVINLMNLGHKNRAVGLTSMNDRSSRSHSCVTVHVQGSNLTSGSIIHGRMHLVDLAGSERADKSEAVGDRLMEAQHISRSLSALGDVIASLAQKQSHVPYRNSKLTQLLQDSLGGQAKTLMFVHICPEPDALGETISTLKFAERVSTVELRGARSNKESTDVRELKEQIASLKGALLRKEKGELDGGTAGSFASSPSPSWQSTGDEQSESSSVSRMQSFDLQDFMDSPLWPPVSSLGSTDDEKSVSGDWVDKDMVKYNTSKVYPEQQLNKPTVNKQNSLDNGLVKTRSESAAVDETDDDLEASNSSDRDYRWKNTLSKSQSVHSGGGPKGKKPTPKQTKSPEIRSMIPQPPTRRVSNGGHSPLQKAGKKPVSVDGKRRPAVGK